MEVVIFLVLIFSAMAAFTAQSKGRSSGFWFFLGLLFGPLALILVALLPKDQQAIDQNLLNVGEMRKCPQCAEIIKSEAIKCRYCQSDLDPQTKTPPIKRARDAHRECKHCGALYSYADLECPMCGK